MHLQGTEGNFGYKEDCRLKLFNTSWHISSAPVSKGCTLLAERMQSMAALHLCMLMATSSAVHCTSHGSEL